MNQLDDFAQDGAEFSMPTSGEVIARKYRVDGVVGTGGMGVVLSATHLELGQRVAIKVLTIPEDYDRRDEARERFLREGRATAALVSDHVVRVYDVGTLDNGAPFMVMELLRGRDLAVTLQQVGPLPIEHAADYVRQAADAIACAHAIGIVHRDLKPSNLFLTQRSDGSPLIKVLDFGISKTTPSEFEPVTGLTAAHGVLGTPFYMSPEQVRDAKMVDFRSDIWSLGAILHELLAGTPAFEGSTLPGVCAAIAADPPAALRLIRSEVPIELEAIVLKCLEKAPSRRFQDIRDLSRKLATWSGRPESISLLPLSDKTIRSSPLTLGLAELQQNPTISERAGDMGTMASAVFTRSGARSAASAPAVAVVKEQQTLSAAPTTSASPNLAPQSPAQSSATRRSLGFIAAGLLALFALGAWALRGPNPAERSIVPAATPSPLAAATQAAIDGASFSLQIESSPLGAQVFEGENLLGSTPLHLTLDSATVAGAPRSFTVRKAGYGSYTIVQGAARKDARVLAELTAEPGAALPSALPRRPLPELKAPIAKPKDPAAPVPADIFMQR